MYKYVLQDCLTIRGASYSIQNESDSTGSFQEIAFWVDDPSHEQARVLAANVSYDRPPALLHEEPLPSEAGGGSAAVDVGRPGDVASVEPAEPSLLTTPLNHKAREEQ